MAYGDNKENPIKIPKRSSKGDLPTNEKEWVTYVNKFHDAGLHARRRHERQWIVNYCYYKGYQNLIYDTTTGIFSLSRELEQPLVVNRIGSFIEGRHAKITKNRPTTKVMPQTNDKLDRNAAKYAEQALAYLQQKIGMEGTNDRAKMLMLLFGNSFIKTCWDPLAGDTIENLVKGGENQDTLFIDDEEGKFKTEEVFLGEVASNALTPFQILPANDSIPTVKGQPAMMERHFLPVTEIENMFPHLVGKVPKSNREHDKTDSERTLDRLASPLFAAYANDKYELQDTITSEALLKILWVKPNQQFEDGACVGVVGNELAFAGTFENDYGDNIYPFVKYSEREDGLSFWQQSTLERLIPIQRAHNKIKQKKLSNAILMANGKWMLAKGSQVMEEAITDEEGEVVEYNPAVPEPHQAQIAPLPNYVQAMDAEFVVDIRDVGGQRETTYAPGPNITAGVAMQTQAELTDEIIGPLIKNIARSDEKVAQIQLILINDEWVEPRKIKVIGEKGSQAVQWLQAADFRNHTDVRIESESMFPDFRGARQQRIFDLWDRRIISDPKEFWELYRWGNFDLIEDKQDAIEDTIWLDIARIKKGKTPEFQPFQNHGQYIQTLMQWVNTPEFNKLIPERKQLALSVIKQHMDFMTGQVSKQEPQPEQNPAAVGTPFGPAKTGPISGPAQPTG